LSSGAPKERVVGGGIEVRYIGWYPRLWCCLVYNPN
jgi:hypothetical protein